MKYLFFRYHFSKINLTDESNFMMIVALIYKYMTVNNFVAL